MLDVFSRVKKINKSLVELPERSGLIIKDLNKYM
jgi:hypothetical protein